MMKYGKASLLAGCFLLSGLVANGQDAGQDAELTNEEYQLKLEIEKVRERINQYDKYQQTFIPDSWRMPVIKKMISMADWSLSDLDEQAEWCSQFMNDIKTWTNIEVVEPYIKTNTFGHVTLQDYHKCDRNGTMNFPHYVINPGSPTFCSGGYRVYDMSDGAGGQDLFMCFDGRAKEAGNFMRVPMITQNEPFSLTSISYPGGIANFTSSESCQKTDLKVNGFGFGGSSSINSLFASIRGTPERTNDPRFKNSFAHDTDIFVLKYYEKQIVTTYTTVVPNDIEYSLNNESNNHKKNVYLNIYHYEQKDKYTGGSAPKCVLNAHLDKVETIMGEKDNANN